jgi:streptogramin lyase
MEPHDPIAPLPVTSATDRLLVSTVGDDGASFLLLDLGRGRSTPLGELSEDVHSAAFGGTTLAYQRDDRTIDLVDVAAPDVVTTVPLPDDVAGRIASIAGDALGFVVETRVPVDPAAPNGRVDHGPDVLFGPRGDLRCVADATVAPSTWDVDLIRGELWIDGMRARIDRTTCAERPGLQDLPGEPDWIAVADDGGLVLAMGDTVMAYDAVTGTRRAESPPLGNVVQAVAVTDGALWAVVDGKDLVQLDAARLEVEHRAGPLECGDSAFLLAGGGSLWLVDDCDGILAEVDPTTGDYVDAWWLPHDQASDKQITADVVGDGIWLVDIEQTGDPYRFDFGARRFERVPIPRAEAERIFALEWDVIPGP